MGVMNTYIIGEVCNASATTTPTQSGCSTPSVNIIRCLLGSYNSFIHRISHLFIVMVISFDFVEKSGNEAL